MNKIDLEGKHAEREAVSSQHLRHTVREAVRRVAVLPRHVAGIHAEAAAAIFGIVACNHNAGQLAAKTVVEDRAHPAVATIWSNAARLRIDSGRPLQRNERCGLIFERYE